jgi:hypothetical protein
MSSRQGCKRQCKTYSGLAAFAGYRSLQIDARVFLIRLGPSGVPLPTDRYGQHSSI